ncbi:Veg family protein [Curtanaerobium respiraculi]|uniref:Veg family protein n=1 Tax=Curtanaerobium respiraculi TaxID=2949669 RepID=UPI0024B367C8|nr:Veg family protein [Curtanaerobium respiraculi]
MELEQQANIVTSIHDTLDSFVGQRLRVRANMGRSKIIESEGVLVQVHPQLFIMEVDHKRGRKARQSYQYVDVLTGTVQLSQNGESLFGPLLEALNEKPEDKMTVEAPTRLLD